jgi:hypothetical protein
VHKVAASGEVLLVVPLPYCALPPLPLRDESGAWSNEKQVFGTVSPNLAGVNKSAAFQVSTC